MHGGLTAAIIDETLGGLMFSLKRSQHITLPGPMFTVGGGFGAGSVGWGTAACQSGLRLHRAATCRELNQLLPLQPIVCPLQVQLDISYKAKIDAGAVVLCTAEVESLEGRKLWMKVGRRCCACAWLLA